MSIFSLIRSKLNECFDFWDTLEGKVLSTNLFLGRLLIFLKCVAQHRLVTSILVLTENPILSTKVSFKRRKEETFFFVWKKLVHTKTGLLGHSVYPTENVSKDWLGSLGFSLTPIDSNFYIPCGSRKKPSLIMDEIKFVFSKKATKIDQIFAVDLTFTK